MDPITIAALGSVAGPILSGLVGKALAAGDEAEARRLQKMATDAISGVHVPELEKLVAEHQGDTELRNIKVDPATRSAQMAALQKLQQVGSENGLTAEDRAKLLDAEGEANNFATSNRASVLQNAQMRGVGGSGMELAAALQGGQSASNRMMRANTDTAAAASQRALQAMMSAGQLGGQIHSQDYGEQERAASAQDQINKFNTGLNTDANYYNTTQRPMNQYQMDSSHANSVANAYTNEANQAGGRAANTNQMAGQIGQGAGMGAAAYGQYAANGNLQDQQQKNWVADYKAKYKKDPNTGEPIP